MMRQKLLCWMLIFSMLFMTTTVQAESNALTETPRYLQTDKFGYYACYTNVLWQYTENGWEQVLDLGAGTTARNRATGETINDWRSFYITDLTAGYFNEHDHYERILISGLVMVPSKTSDTQGRLVDVFILYYPQTGRTDTLHMNFRYPMAISKEQHNMTKPFEYLESNALFPRGIITKNYNSYVYVLSGAADLGLLKSANQSMLEAKGYNGDFFEIVRITSSLRVYSEFYGPLTIFEKEHNPNFRIPELEGMTHTIDRRLIVFNTKDYQEFAIASVGTDDSDFCTDIQINIKTKPKDEYYWIERDRFLQMAGMTGLCDSFGVTWTEKDMDSYIDK